MKKIEAIKFVNQNGDDYTIGKPNIDIKLVVAAGVLAGVLTLAIAGIVAVCRKHKSK